MLTKYEVQVIFIPEESGSLTLNIQGCLIFLVTILQEEEQKLQTPNQEVNHPYMLEAYPEVWAENFSPGMAKNQVPIIVVPQAKGIICQIKAVCHPKGDTNLLTRTHQSAVVDKNPQSVSVL